jgi:hypothetical protein
MLSFMVPQTRRCWAILLINDDGWIDLQDGIKSDFVTSNSGSLARVNAGRSRLVVG